MRTFQSGWIGLAGIILAVASGGCANPEPYPSDRGTGAGGGGGTGGAASCALDVDCAEMSMSPCMRAACSLGNCVEEPDDSLAPTDDGNPCTTDACVNGGEFYTNNMEPCGSNPPMTHCADGECIGCMVAEDCGPKTECKIWSCSEEHKCIAMDGPTDLFADPAGDCTARSCSDMGVLVEGVNLSDAPADDGNECTKEECMGLGMPIHTPQQGQACGGGPTCVDGAAKAQDNCDATGVCVAGSSSDCAPYACDADACKTSCTLATDCTAAFYCDVGQSKCFQKKASGATCSSGEECSGMFCPDDDKVCCASACIAACKSCNVGGMAGTCGNLSKGVTDKCPNNQVCNDSGGCTGVGSKAAVGQSCNLSSDCFNHVSGGPPECVNLLCRLHVGEVCDTAKPHECDTNLCDPVTHTCKECTADNDCPIMACDTANKRCYISVGGVCGTTADCTPGKTCVSNVCQ